MDLSRIDAIKRQFINVAESVCPGFTIRNDQKVLMHDIFAWCMMMPGKYDPNKGLWLHGDIGTGKSTMLEIVKQFCGLIRPKFEGKFPYSFRTSNAITVCGEFADNGYNGIESYITSRRQAFDELGSEYSPTSHYGTVDNVMQYILQRRYDNRHESFTHVTTNLTIEQVSERYGARIYDRCKEMFNFVEMRGKTFRKN